VVHNGLAEVLKAQGRLDEAEAVYRETTQRFPDNPVTYRGLAEVLKRRDAWRRPKPCTVRPPSGFPMTR